MSIHDRDGSSHHHALARTGESSSEQFSKEGVAKQLDNCSYCPKMCRHACPVSTSSGKETWTPQSKMNQLNQLRIGKRDMNAEQADPLWACTGCRHCTTYCDHGNEPGLVLFSGRAEAVAQGANNPALIGYGERFRKRDVRLAGQLQELARHAGVLDDDATDGAPVGFWPGCDSVDKGPGDVVASMALFDRIGADDVSLITAPQVCAGYPLLAAGLPDQFRWHAGKVAQTLRAWPTVVMNCSACLYTVRSQYPALGLPIPREVMSLAEFMAARGGSLTASNPSNKRTVYYHDPCYHARYSGILEAPREALGRVADVREFSWGKTDTECCGGGGLLPKTKPLVADQMARRRLGEIGAKGGGLVVTSCGTCAFMLRRNAPDSVEVADLPTALAMLSGTNFDSSSPASSSDADDD